MRKSVGARIEIKVKSKKEIIMAKRFYDTGLVDQEWYMNLSPKGKALYMYLLCKCDVAGVFEANYKMMSMYVNDTITEEDVFGSFGNRVIPLSGNGTKGIIVDFVQFQCGGEINPKVKAHQAILRRLGELNIPVSTLQEWCNHELKYVPIEMRNEEESVAQESHNEEASQEERKNKELRRKFVDELFDKFWMYYPKKTAKVVAKAKFTTIMMACKDGDAMLGIMKDMMTSLMKSSKSEQWQKDGGKFIPMPTTWLNQRRWEDEGIVLPEEKSKAESMSIAENIASAGAMI